MMELDALEQIINTVGFPAVTFLLMFYLVNSTLRDLQNTINENTKILTKLSERLGGDDELHHS